MIAVFLGFINMTKVPESDLAFHASGYLSARGVSLYQYLFFDFGGKEIAFYSFNYLMYYLTGGSVKCWIFVITLVGYFPLFIAIHRFLSLYNSSAKIIIFSIIVAAFFPQLFGLSAHLIRQFIAGSFATYFLVEKIFYKKTYWIVLILGVLTHSSSAILFLLGFCSFLEEPPRAKNIVKYVTFISMLLGYQTLASYLLSVSDSSTINYALVRASKDTTFDAAGKLGIVHYSLIAIMLFILYKNVISNTRELTTKIHKPLFFLSSIVVVQILFILVNLRQEELSLRLFFYLCFFFPLIVPMQFRLFPFNNYIPLVSISVIFFFLMRLNSSTWTYASLSELLSSSSIQFFIREEFHI